MSVNKFSDLDGPERQKIVAMDLDGTLAHYTHWKGPEHIGDPVPLADTICRILHEAGVKVIVHTCRTNRTMNRISGIDTNLMVRDIGAWLHEHDLGFIGVNEDEGKPFAQAYPDDRGVHFPKNGQGDLHEIKSQLELLLGVFL